ncbi:MAG: DRTGG domain-containing protein [Eubacteriales bacterium]|jgi:predicted transcriptional regulator|nr:DRTGG domain-containing protein [Eubacteriales bacterium]
MDIQEIAGLVSAQVLYEPEAPRSADITSAVAADLMSEVMVGTADGSLIITGLMNPQVIRTAEMVNAAAVLFVRGKKIPDQVMSLASDSSVAVMRTDLMMFEACGVLFREGLKPGRRYISCPEGE